MRKSRSTIARLGIATWMVVAVGFATRGEAQALSPTMAPLGFLVGRWTSEQGQAESGKAKGAFSIEAAAGGTALLRRDHTEVTGAGGVQSMDQIMLIYPENGQLRADYFDGSHAIHYQDVMVAPGHSVRFTTRNSPGTPMFRLTYGADGANRLSVRFEMLPPGQSAFRTVAEGTARRSE